MSKKSNGVELVGFEDSPQPASGETFKGGIPELSIPGVDMSSINLNPSDQSDGLMDHLYSEQSGFNGNEDASLDIKYDPVSEGNADDSHPDDDFIKKLAEKTQSKSGEKVTSETKSDEQVSDKKVTDEKIPVHDEATLRMAKSLGFTDEEINGYADPKQLDKDVTRLAFRAAQMGITPEKIVQDEVKSMVEPKPEATPKVDQEPDTKPILEKFDLSKVVDLEDMEPEFVKTVTAVQDHLNKVIDQINQVAGDISRHQTFIEYSRQREERSLADEFDGRIETLCTDTPSYRDVFGKGSIYDLDEKSEHFQNRSKLCANYAALMKSFPGQITPSDAFRMAVNHTFPEIVKADIKKEVEKDVVNRLRDTKGRFVTPSNGKARGPEYTPEELILLGNKKIIGEPQVITQQDREDLSMNLFY